MTNLDVACKAFGWAGGTIHQVASELGLSRNKTHELITMPRAEFNKLVEARARVVR
jgi:hypothetical protein